MPPDSMRVPLPLEETGRPACGRVRVAVDKGKMVAHLHMDGEVGVVDVDLQMGKSGEHKGADLG